MRAAAKQTLGAATRAVSPKVTERASSWRKGYAHSEGHRLLLKRYDRCVKASTLASLPSQALRASSPKGRAFAEEAKPRGISKASLFGRGVTEGDGEGKPVAKRLVTQRWAGSLSERCYRNMAASLSAALPSQALRASSPKGRAFTGQGETSAHRLTSYFVITYYPSHDEYRHQFIITVWRCGIKSQTVNFIKK